MMKRTHHSLLGMIVGEPFMIDPRGLDMILTIAARETVTPEMLEQYPGKPVDRATGLTRRGDVGIVSIQGPIFRHADMFDRISGATTTETIAEDLGVARTSSQIKSVVLKINSPGGQAASIGELAGMIRELDAEKPVTMYADFSALSAAYYLGAAAGKRVAHKASFLGSIGTIAAWTSVKGAQEALGLKDIVVVSPQTPKKGIDPESDEGLKDLEDRLAFLSDHFINDVASYTGKSRKRVLEDFGQGGVVNADQALEVGMVDDLSTFEQVVSRVSGGRRYRSSGSTGPTPSSSDGSFSGVFLMPRKTWGEFFSSLAGKRHDEEVPLNLDPDAESPSPSPENRGGKKDETDDPQELKRQLAEERQARQKAESEVSQGRETVEKDRIVARVKTWVGQSIHPHELKEKTEHCLRLLSADRNMGVSGSEGLLESHCRFMESPSRKLGLLDESVVNKRPPAGGKVEAPPVSADVPAGSDPWTADRAALAADAERYSGAPGSSNNGMPK